MADGFIGEIRAFGFNFTPRGWIPCDGSVLSIQAFSTLYAIIGTQFGGNGTSQFQVPDLRGVTGLGVNINASGFNVPGAKGGTETVTLTSNEMPAHTHMVGAVTRSSIAQTSVAKAQTANDCYLTNAFCVGQGKGIIAYADTANTTLNPQSISPAGGSLPHDNMSPYLAMTYCICVEGEWPQRP